LTPIHGGITAKDRVRPSDRTDYSESRTNGKNGRICAADCAFSLREQPGTQLNGLLPLIVDFVQNGIYIQRGCNYGVGDLPLSTAVPLAC
jgi:hypothetical protein